MKIHSRIWSDSKPQEKSAASPALNQDNEQTPPQSNVPKSGTELVHSEYVAETTAEILRLKRELRYAEVRLKDREHKGRPHDPPEVLRTLGFWPDCECCECWA